MYIVFCIALPIKGKPPPSIVPSTPNLTLFINSAAAFFLPVKPFVLLGVTIKPKSLPGSDARKSVAPKTVAPSKALL